MQKYHPDSALFLENVNFSDMPDDFREVCDAFGDPIVVNHEDHSTTNRTRAYWLQGIDLPENWQVDQLPINPDSLMDSGRTVERYYKHHVRPITASWALDEHGQPTNSSHRKFLVHDANTGRTTGPRPHEAELLHGLPRDYTAADDVSVVDRLHGIGDGWDLHVVDMFFKHWSPLM